MRSCAILALSVAAAAPATAQSSPQAPQAAPERSAQGELSVTIYNNDQALVQDTRQLSLPAGRTRQEFADVSAQIRPETVTLAADGTGIVEQNFDYDLLTPDKLMEKAVGQTVTLVRTGPDGKTQTRETARVLADNNGTVVQIGERIEVLGPSDRVIFPALPPNLRARPTLSVTLDSAQAGTRPATLSYLTRGLGWSADYVALFDERAGKLDVQGWVTLTNQTGTSFTNARTLLVANGTGRVPRPTRPGTLNPGTQTAAREQLGDYYLYPLPQRTTIANAQQKQVSFLDVHGAAAVRAYSYRNAWLGTLSDPASVDSVLRFSSAREGGLGDALPAGTIRVYMRDARGQPQFVGESAIPHAPMGSNLAIKTGQAFDVKVQPTVESRERVNDTRWRTSMRYRFTNAKPQPVTVEFFQSGLDWGTDTRVVAESQESERPNADDALWRVTVPANGETVLTATFDTRY